MASIKSGERYRVYLQDSRGVVFEVDAIAASIEVTTDMINTTSLGDLSSTFMPGHQTIDINLRGIGEAVVRNSRDMKQQPAEWKCAWCGRPNKRERETCKSCGAVRPFVYS